MRSQSFFRKRCGETLFFSVQSVNKHLAYSKMSKNSNSVEEDLSKALKLVMETVKAVQEVKPVDKTPEEKEAQRAAFLALPSNMSLAQQCEEMRKHADTPMTYAEMRMRFG